MQILNWISICQWLFMLWKESQFCEVSISIYHEFLNFRNIGPKSLEKQWCQSCRGLTWHVVFKSSNHTIGTSLERIFIHRIGTFHFRWCGGLGRRPQRPVNASTLGIGCSIDSGSGRESPTCGWANPNSSISNSWGCCWSGFRTCLDSLWNSQPFNLLGKATELYLDSNAEFEYGCISSRKAGTAEHHSWDVWFAWSDRKSIP